MNRRASLPFRLMPMVAVMGIIFFLSCQPGDSFSLPPVPQIDKLAHMTIYGLLAAAVIFAFSNRWKSGRPGMVMLITVLFCTFYGLSDEFHQSFVPGRWVSGYDLLADSCGAAIICLLWARWRKKFALIGQAG